MTDRYRPGTNDIVQGSPVCPKCGWYQSFGHTDRCRPAAGRTADKLAALVPDVPSTKLGYGDHMVTFEIDDETHVRFEVSRGNNAFSLREVWAFERVTPEKAARLVELIAAWSRS